MSTPTIPTTQVDWANIIRQHEQEAVDAQRAKYQAAKTKEAAAGNPFLSALSPNAPEPEIVGGYDEQGERRLTEGQQDTLADLIEEYRAHQEDIAFIEGLMKETRGRIEEILDGAEFKGTFPTGSISYTFPTPRKTLDKKRFEEEHPILAGTYADVTAGYMKEGKRTARLTISAPATPKE